MTNLAAEFGSVVFVVSSQKENIKVDSVLELAELNSDLDIKIEVTDLKDSDTPKENTSQTVSCS